MRIPRPTHATVVAYAALFLALSGTAYAATGGTFVLGRGNSAATPTGLANSAGTPMVLNAKSGYAPLAVNSTTKVNRLNADLIDGLDSSGLQRRLNGSCVQGSAIRTIFANGTVACDEAKARVFHIQEPIGTTLGSQDLGIGYAGCPTAYAVVGGGYIAGTWTEPAARHSGVRHPRVVLQP